MGCILCLDANDVLGRREKGLEGLMKESGLTDVLGRLHKNIEGTCSRGGRRLDYILCSPELEDHVSWGGMIRYNEIKMSDHRGLFVDINMKQMGLSLESRIGVTNRILSGKRPNTIKK